LYYALTGEQLDAEAGIEMANLNTVFYSKIRNDIAFIVKGILIVILEHQSTLCLNMPVRMLQYVVLMYEFFCQLGKNLYRQKRIMLPKPVFYVLYNGTEPYPAQSVMRLSEAFGGMQDGEQPQLELTVRVININRGANPEIMKRSKDLEDYSILVAKVRHWQQKGLTLKAALHQAVKECRKEDILTAFLDKYKNEVINMLFLEYDENLMKEAMREEGLEEGIEIGEARGIEIGEARGEVRGIEIGEARGGEKRLLRMIRRKIEANKNLSQIIHDLMLDPEDEKYVYQFNDYKHLLN
jgi:hypothetical protein